MKKIFKLSNEAIEHLKKCERMAFLVEHLGEIEEREIVIDPFMGMVYNIIYQQVSFASGNAIWKRWMEKYGSATPENILEVEDEELRACGLSRAKVSYVRNLAMEAIGDSRLRDREQLIQLTEEEIYNIYTKIKGIGPWSVKMFLIFTLGREDIRSYGDLALKRGVEWLFGEEEITDKRYLELTEGYSPYNTAASFYFWEITLQKLLKQSKNYDEWKSSYRRDGGNMLVDISQETKIGKVYRPGSPPLDVREITCNPGEKSEYKTIEYSIATHNMGTHIDVMGVGIDLPLERLIGRGLKFDVSHITDRPIEEEDIDLSLIEGGEFIFFQTNWDRYLMDERYDNHPEISISLVERLASMDINMIGIDALGVGRGKNHGTIDRLLGRAGKYAIENLCNLDKVPEKGFKVYCLPTKIEGLDALPARILVEY